jgi:hypothetical protein
MRPLRPVSGIDGEGGGGRADRESMGQSGGRSRILER